MSLESVFKKFVASPLHVIGYPLAAVFFVALKICRVFAKPVYCARGPKVISIGNLDFGGSGKTPTLLLFLKYFGSQNIAVVSRGYKSQLENEGSTCVNKLSNVNASVIGDEPMLIHSKYPSISLFVGADKQLSLQSCLDKDFIFLDDAAQSHSIKKDLSIILVDPERPIKPLFPAGYRRDLLTTLKKADFVIVPYCESMAIYNKAKCMIRHYTQAPICGLKAHLNLTHASDTIALLTTIANPSRLKKQLESLGYSVVYQNFLDDHQMITEKIIVDFEKKARCFGAKTLCMTEKDLVKIPHEHQNKFSIIKLELIPAYESYEWESFIGKIQKMS